MRNTTIFAASLAAFFILAPASYAAEPDAATTPVDAAVSPAAADSNLDKIVCRTLAPVVGSRLGGKRQCTTQREWDRIRRDSQNLTNNTQDHTYSESRGP